MSENFALNETKHCTSPFSHFSIDEEENKKNYLEEFLLNTEIAFTAN
jgi:hypothetical protein